MIGPDLSIYNVASLRVAQHNRRPSSSNRPFHVTEIELLDVAGKKVFDIRLFGDHQLLAADGTGRISIEIDPGNTAPPPSPEVTE